MGFPPCCTLSVMFSRTQSSLSNVSHPAPRLFLAQDTFCITADVTGPKCYSRAYLCCSAPLNHIISCPCCHLPASSAQRNHKWKPNGNHNLRRGKRKWLTCVVAFSQEGERTNILSFGTGTQGKKSHRKKKQQRNRNMSPHLCKSNDIFSISL